MLWLTWIKCVSKLRNAFSREKTFLWFIAALIGFSTRSDHLGVSSIIRALGLRGRSYECLRHFFYSDGIDLGKLTHLWWKVIEKVLNNLLVTFNGRRVFLIDGIKIGKEGRRMPGVKWLFQESQNNSKSEYIYGHSCQAMHVLVSAGKSILAIPLVMRIHEGIGQQGSLIMKILNFVLAIKMENSYIVGDAYYWSANLSKELLKREIYLVSRVKSNGVAYHQPEKKKGVGRPAKYGKKIKLKQMFCGTGFKQTELELYGQKTELEYKERVFLCKNHQTEIKYVFVKIGGNNCILCSSDTSLDATQVIELYAHRFKIEFSFKEFIHDFGGGAYRFWSKDVDRSRKRGVEKRDTKTESAYHVYLQLAVIAQGLANIIAVLHPKEVWKEHQTWLRTIRPGLVPSAAVTRMALRNCVSNIMQLDTQQLNLMKFLKKRQQIDGCCPSPAPDLAA